MTFGEKLQFLRASAGLNQAELASQIGIERSYLSKLENNKSIPSSDVFYRLKSLFQLTSNELLADVDPDIIKKDFNHIPDINEGLQKSKQLIQCYRKIWFILFSSFIVIGLVTFLAGKLTIIYPNIAYNYTAKSANTADNKRTSYYFFTFEEKRETSIQHNNREAINYSLYHTVTISRWSNRLLMAIGLWCCCIGVTAILLEKPLHTHPTSKA